VFFVPFVPKSESRAAPLCQNPNHGGSALAQEIKKYLNFGRSPAKMSWVPLAGGHGQTNSPLRPGVGCSFCSRLLAMKSQPSFNTPAGCGATGSGCQGRHDFEGGRQNRKTITNSRLHQKMTRVGGRGVDTPPERICGRKGGLGGTVGGEGSRYTPLLWERWSLCLTSPVKQGWRST
jgi:hypothetical protein